MCIRCSEETVTELRAEIGDFVHKGEVLAVIRSGEVADYEKQLKEALNNNSCWPGGTWMPHRICTLPAWHRIKMYFRPSRNWQLREAEERRIKEIFSIYHFSGNAFYRLKSPVSGFIVEKQISRDMQLRPDQGMRCLRFPVCPMYG